MKSLFSLSFYIVSIILYPLSPLHYINPNLFWTFGLKHLRIYSTKLIAMKKLNGVLNALLLFLGENPAQQLRSTKKCRLARY